MPGGSKDTHKRGSAGRTRRINPPNQLAERNRPCFRGQGWRAGGRAGGAPDRGSPKVAERPVFVIVVVVAAAATAVVAVDALAVIGRLVVFVFGSGGDSGDLGRVGGDAEVGAGEVRAGYLHHAPECVLGGGVRWRQRQQWGVEVGGGRGGWWLVL